MSFKDKVVIITGASSGIGASTAISFAKEGANVVIVGRNETKLEAVNAKLKTFSNKHMVIKSDITNDAAAKKVIDDTIARFGKLDVLVNNAGFSKSGTITDGTVLEAYDQIMLTNVRAVIHLTTLAAPYLKKTNGNIVNISSAASMKTPPRPEFLSYSVSKAALDHFTRGAALELAPHIRVNCINPGPVKTDFMENAGFENDVWDMMKNNTVLKRLSEPEEIARLILLVAGDGGLGITGSTIVCDNGVLLKR